MAYIGNTAASRFVSNRAVTQLSGDGSTVAFTLEQVVTQDEDVLVSVDGVVQEPSVAYAVSSGTTLTFDAAPSANAGNNIFVYYLASQAGTVGHPSTQALSATNGTFSGTLAVTGVLTGTSLDISGNIDIDGTSNLDIVDIDGTVNMASTALVTGVLTANGGAVFNEGSADVDFRIESNNFTHALFINGADGVVQLGNTDDDPVFNNSVGCSFNSNNGSSVRGVGQFSCSGAVAGRFNRTNEDGAIIGIHSEGAQEGTISVSGGTTSYNAFSGSHWSRLADNSKPTILKGTIIETIDEMCDWYQAEFTVDSTTRKVSIALPSDKSVGDTITQTYRGTDYSATIIKEKDNKHTKCKISDTADSKRVYGVFAAFDNDDDTVNDMYVTAVGTHVVRINSGVTVAAGDLLVSNGDGTAKKLAGNTSMTADVYSSIIGKVLTNIKQETYDDDSYTVPCALYCG